MFIDFGNDGAVVGEVTLDSNVFGGVTGSGE